MRQSDFLALTASFHRAAHVTGRGAAGAAGAAEKEAERAAVAAAAAPPEGVATPSRPLVLDEEGSPLGSPVALEQPRSVPSPPRREEESPKKPSGKHAAAPKRTRKRPGAGRSSRTDEESSNAPSELTPHAMERAIAESNILQNLDHVSVAMVRGTYRSNRMKEDREIHERGLGLSRDLMRRLRSQDEGVSGPGGASSAEECDPPQDEEPADAVDHTFERLVYKDVCMNDIAAQSMMNTMKKKLRAGETIRLECCTEDHQGSEEDCRRLLRTVYMWGASYAHDNVVPDISWYEKVGGRTYYVDMKPHSRYAQRRPY